mgnify:CR=1 FL=1
MNTDSNGYKGPLDGLKVIDWTMWQFGPISTVMLADMTDWPRFNAAYLPYFKGKRLPARSAFGANGLALGAPLEVECIAAQR